ncbi:hypothetical protein [Nesterenkonia rhizosphaerae]|uniref:Uncharacterized protein n=1 Tax=Nesterenkonia rhizosphaerae TaxID=1348272 RepID=A0ABP9G041_9MICC
MAMTAAQEERERRKDPRSKRYTAYSSPESNVHLTAVDSDYSEPMSGLQLAPDSGTFDYPPPFSTAEEAVEFYSRVDVPDDYTSAVGEAYRRQRQQRIEQWRDAQVAQRLEAVSQDDAARQAVVVRQEVEDMAPDDSAVGPEINRRDFGQLARASMLAETAEIFSQAGEDHQAQRLRSAQFILAGKRFTLDEAHISAETAEDARDIRDHPQEDVARVIRDELVPQLQSLRAESTQQQAQVHELMEGQLAEIVTQLSRSGDTSEASRQLLEVIKKNSGTSLDNDVASFKMLSRKLEHLASRTDHQTARVDHQTDTLNYTAREVGDHLGTQAWKIHDAEMQIGDKRRQHDYKHGVPVRITK